MRARVQLLGATSDEGWSVDGEGSGRRELFLARGHCAEVAVQVMWNPGI